MNLLVLLLGKGMSMSRCELAQVMFAGKALMSQSPILQVGEVGSYGGPWVLPDRENIVGLWGIGELANHMLEEDVCTVLPHNTNTTHLEGMEQHIACTCSISPGMLS